MAYSFLMKENLGPGPLMTLSDAARKAGIHQRTIAAYVTKGYLPTYIDGTVVYYRDVLRASWLVSEKHRKTSGKASPNYKNQGSK